MDEDDCIVDVTRFYMEFCVDESCGKCAPCRIGTKRMLQILEKITKGQGEMADIDKLKAIGLATKKASLCGLGQTAANPVLSTLKYFENEYLEHIKERKCSSGTCKDLVTYSIDPEKCIGCTVCARKCPVNCISGERKSPHKLIRISASSAAPVTTRVNSAPSRLLRRNRMSMVNIQINGKPVAVEAGTSILNAAKSAHVNIPHSLLSSGS